MNETQSMSHKGERRQKYSMELKKEAIKYAKENSINSAAKNSKSTEREFVSGSKKKRK